MNPPTIEQLILLATTAGGIFFQWRSWRNEERRIKKEADDKAEQDKKKADTEARQKETEHRELESRISENLQKTWERDREYANKQIQDLRNDVQHLEGVIRDTKKEKDGFADQLVVVQRELRDARERLTIAEDKATAAERRAVATERENIELKARMSELSQRLSKYENQALHSSEETDHGDKPST